EAEAAAAAELRLVGRGLATGRRAVERRTAEGFPERAARLAARRGRRGRAGDRQREGPGRRCAGCVLHGHRERGGPGGRWRAEEQAGGTKGEPGRGLAGERVGRG